MILIVMRLAEMRRVHPAQVPRHCDRCGHLCGVYPSGQDVIRRDPLTEVVCSHCIDPATVPAIGLAPGAEVEPFESEWRERKGRP